MGLMVAAIMALAFDDYTKHPILYSTPLIPTSTPSPERSPTFPVCEAFVLEQGDPCKFIFTPTPLSACPAISNGGICTYDGPASILSAPTPTPFITTPYAEH